MAGQSGLILPSAAMIFPGWQLVFIRPASPSMTVSLADAIFWVAVALCTVAQVALLRSFFLGASRPGRDAAATFRATETAWAVLPAMVLVGLFVATWQARSAPPSPGTLRWQAAPAGQVAPALPGAEVRP